MGGSTFLDVRGGIPPPFPPPPLPTYGRILPQKWRNCGSFWGLTWRIFEIFIWRHCFQVPTGKQNLNTFPRGRSLNQFFSSSSFPARKLGRDWQCFQIRRICAKMAHLDPVVAHLFCQFARSAKTKKYGAFWVFRLFPENYYKFFLKKEVFKRNFFSFFSEFFVN